MKFCRKLAIDMAQHPTKFEIDWQHWWWIPQVQFFCFHSISWECLKVRVGEKHPLWAFLLLSWIHFLDIPPQNIMETSINGFPIEKKNEKHHSDEKILSENLVSIAPSAKTNRTEMAILPIVPSSLFRMRMHNLIFSFQPLKYSTKATFWWIFQYFSACSNPSNAPAH